MMSLSVKISWLLHAGGFLVLVWLLAFLARQPRRYSETSTSVTIIVLSAAAVRLKEISK